MMQTTSSATAFANIGAVTSVAAAGVTWVAELNAYLQLGATTVAIIAGVLAIIWHVKKLSGK